jgi:hypothetical protein
VVVTTAILGVLMHNSDNTEVQGWAIGHWYMSRALPPVRECRESKVDAQTALVGKDPRVYSGHPETPGTQQAMVLNQFGAVLNASDQQPLAQNSSAHVNTVIIGNNGNLRATDTLLDFIFVHDRATVEPTVSVTRSR